ncbi:hypothetical protein LZ31DRAFT_131720 [Colletotrichum somersetense]|nr:hypothetical protein LZ31DRAFT_131720 [Colletotrichum somersetense]
MHAKTLDESTGWRVWSCCARRASVFWLDPVGRDVAVLQSLRQNPGGLAGRGVEMLTPPSSINPEDDGANARTNNSMRAGRVGERCDLGGGGAIWDEGWRSQLFGCARGGRREGWKEIDGCQTGRTG